MVGAVGIFGGSFDPPHSAHVTLLENVQKKYRFREIWVVPSKYPPGKTPLAPYAKRLEWCKKIFAKQKHIKVSDFEASGSQTKFGWDIYSHFQMNDPQTHFEWILGEDQWAQLQFWKNIDEYGGRLSWLVLSRDPKTKAPGWWSKRLPQKSMAYRWAEIAPMPEISSTAIRNFLEERTITHAEKKNSMDRPLAWIPKQIRAEVLECYSRKASSQLNKKS